MLHNEFDMKVKDMSKVSDASDFGCLMDLAHAVNTIHRYVANPSKEH